jgi:hypothetical protein
MGIAMTRFEYVHIFGPARSGKTLNKEALKKHYQCDIIVDDLGTCAGREEFDRSVEYALKLAEGRSIQAKPEFCRVLLISNRFGIERRVANTLENLDVRTIPIKLAKEALGHLWTEPFNN